MIELLLPGRMKAYPRNSPSREGTPRRDTPEALKKSLDEAHFQIRWDKWEIRILRWLLITTLGFLGWLVNFLLPYAIHGMVR